MSRLSVGSLLLVGLGTSVGAWSAPCCGGSSALPQLITGDDRAQVTAGMSESRVIGDAPSAGIPVFRADGNREVTRSFRMDGAYLLSDRFQVGAGTSLLRRSRSLASDPEGVAATGLSDLMANAAYEFMPQWTYSPWLPRGFVFSQVLVPMGPSVYDAHQTYLVDARSRGFWTVAAGFALVKTWGNWDALMSAEVHRPFARSFSGSDGQTLALEPDLGASGTAGIGFSPMGGSLRLGLSLAVVHEGEIQARGEFGSRSESQRVWNASAQAAYLISSDWSTSLAYADQTLVGPAKNTSLSRSLSLTLQRRWEL